MFQNVAYRSTVYRTGTTAQHHTGHAKLAWQGSSLCYGVRLQHNIHKLGSYIAQGKSQSDNGAEMILPHLKNTSNHYDDAAQNKDHDLSILLKATF